MTYYSDAEPGYSVIDGAQRDFVWARERLRQMFSHVGKLTF